MGSEFKPLQSNRRTHETHGPAPAGVATLPPPGDARDDVLKARTDQLAEQAETQPRVDGGTTGPEDIELERELVGHFDELSVSRPVDGYVYAWVNFTSQHGFAVRSKLARRGWEVVSGTMPEAVELKAVDGSRKLGDCLLMRINKALFLRQQAQDDQERKDQQSSAHATLAELGRRSGVTVHTPDNMSPQMMKTLESRAGQAAFRGAKVAGEQLDRSLRVGTVAGMEVTGR